MPKARKKTTKVTPKKGKPLMLKKITPEKGVLQAWVGQKCLKRCILRFFCDVR
jgi:hypothetical protein